MKKTNIIEINEFHQAQSVTLRQLKNALLQSFGPMGSTTMILKDNQFNKYSKDGKTILDSIRFLGVVEEFCRRDITEITRNIVTTVGDGTTSAIILSSLIFDELLAAVDQDGESLIGKYPPTMIANALKTIANRITDEVRANKKVPTPDDIYNIALISTNGNDYLASELKQVYLKYGNGVFIDVAISPIKETLIKEYDGMTMDTGYGDPAFVNTARGVACLRNAKIYAFKDPVDTPEMTTFMMKILDENIFKATRDKNAVMIPTVIMVPRFGVDTEEYINSLIKQMAGMDNTAKPPILIIKDILEYDRYDDIVTLCGARYIKKYITREAQEQQIKDGLAPSLDNVATWAAGEAEVVESSTTTTKFVNPKNFFDVDAFGNKTHSATYNNHLAFLEQALEEAKKDQTNVTVIGKLKRRINSLRANMVEILVGGISPTDRDVDRDLIEDAVLNCRSAAANGFGRASNIEGALAARKIVDNPEELTDLEFVVADVVDRAYTELLMMLIGTSCKSKDEVYDIVKAIYENGVPYNLKTNEFDNNVLSSIESDVVVMQSIAKIVSIMVTANQCLVQEPILNTYSNKSIEDI